MSGTGNTKSQRHAPAATIAIGWDVGGAMGRKQGVAAVRRSADGNVEWLGEPAQFRLPPVGEPALTPQGLAALVGTKFGPDDHVVVGIDAPLGFPRHYRALVAGGNGPLGRLTRDIDDPFAFRECERWLHATYGKKPMSGPHNMLGANATVAIGHTRWWRSKGFATLPFHPPLSPQRTCIEVYPALEKVAGLLKPQWHALGCQIPSSTRPGTDAYDAAICALLALAFAERGAFGLPVLVEPPAHLAAAATLEGWVYCAEPASVARGDGATVAS